MIISNNKQGSQEWLDEKIGILSGTRIKKIITPAKLELSSGFVDVIDLILDENITGITADKEIFGAQLDRGNNLEPEARSEYTKQTGVNINEHGLCLSDKHNLHGCSPDGFTDDFKGAIEIKCPGFVHLKYCRENKLPSEYKLQVINYFLVNEKLEWLDFVSYRPEFYPKPIGIIRVTREELQADILKVQNAIDLFFDNYTKQLDSYLF